jgi:hypothetical protein
LVQTPYIWKRRADGLYIINLAKTWEKLMLAARIVVAIENPADGEEIHATSAPYCRAVIHARCHSRLIGVRPGNGILSTVVFQPEFATHLVR